MFGPGQRVAGDEVDAFGDVRADRVDDRLLDRTHVGQHRAGGEAGRDLACDVGHGADRHTQDDQIGVRDRLGGGVADPVHKADPAGGVAGFTASSMAHDFVRKAVLADRMGHRPGDEAQPDQRHAAERTGRHAGRSVPDPAARSTMKRPITWATRRQDASSPTVMRRHSGRP